MAVFGLGCLLWAAYLYLRATETCELEDYRICGIATGFIGAAGVTFVTLAALLYFDPSSVMNVLMRM